MREMICITCPLGCHLKVDDSNLEDIKVTGNNCARGIKYAKDECISPKRVVTSIVKVKNGQIKMVSVKTTDAIAKDLIFKTLDELKKITLVAPVKINDVVIKNIFDTGIDIIATKNVGVK